MHKIAIIPALFLTACSFNPSGLPYDGEDAGLDSGIDAVDSTDGSPATDAAFDAAPDAGTGMATVTCSSETVDGHPKHVLTFGGDFASGFLGDAPASAPWRIEYGSNYDSASSNGACQNLWSVPYAAGCSKPYVEWGAEPKLYLDPEVNDLNLALVYGDGTKRWGDLMTSDGDGPGFSVSGTGTDYDCRIVLVNGGTGGYIRIH